MQNPLERVKSIIPHREPFLFIDEILEETETSVVCKRTLRPDEPQFEGHYPGAPIMPGVLLTEMMAQAGAIYSVLKLTDYYKDRPGGTHLLAKIKDVRFKYPAYPGDELIIKAEFEDKYKDFIMLKGKITCNGKVVASCSFTSTYKL